MKKRFIFDLDGTLLHGNFNVERNYFKSMLSKEDYEKFIPIYFECLLDYEEVHDRYDANLLSKYMSEKTNINIAKEFIDGWINVNSTMDDELLTETVDMLRYLKEKKKSLVVLTNWFRFTQESRLKNAGIIGYFDEIYTGDMYLKPHKMSYINACGKYSIDECIMIGDTIEKDVLKPNKYGLDSIYYNKDNKEYDKTKVFSINSFNKIKEMY